jgi:hypothetical protein
MQLALAMAISLPTMNGSTTKMLSYTAAAADGKHLNIFSSAGRAKKQREKQVGANHRTPSQNC